MNVDRFNIFPQRGRPLYEPADGAVIDNNAKHRSVRWCMSARCQQQPVATPVDSATHADNDMKGSLLLQCDKTTSAADTYAATSVLLYQDRLLLQQDSFSFARATASSPLSSCPSSRTLHTHHCRLPGDEHYFTNDQHLRQVIARPFSEAKELVVLSDTALYCLQIADDHSASDATPVQCVSTHDITHSATAEEGEEDGASLYNATCLCAVPQNPHLVLVGTSNGFVKLYDFRAHNQGTAMLSLSAKSVFDASVLAPTINPHYSSPGNNGGSCGGAAAPQQLFSPSHPRLDAYNKYYGSVSFQGVSALHMSSEDTYTILAAFRVPKGGLGMMDLRVNHSATSATDTTNNNNNKRGRESAGRPPLIKSNHMTSTYYLDYGYPSYHTRGSRGKTAALQQQSRHRMYFPFVDICRAHPHHYYPCPQQSAQRVAAIYASSSALTPSPIILLSEDAEVFCTSWSALTSGSIVPALASYQRYKETQQHQQQQQLCSSVEAEPSNVGSLKRAREIPSHHSILDRLRRVERGRQSGTASTAMPPSAVARGKTYTAQGVLVPHLSAKATAQSDLFVSTDKTHRSLLVRTLGRHLTRDAAAGEITIPLPSSSGEEAHVVSMSARDSIIAVHNSRNEACYVKLD